MKKKKFILKIKIMMYLLPVLLVLMILITLLAGAASIGDKLKGFFEGELTSQGKSISDYDSEEEFLLSLLKSKKGTQEYLGPEFFESAHMTKKDFKKMLNEIKKTNKGNHGTSQNVTYAYKSKSRDYVEVPSSVGSVPVDPNKSNEGGTTGSSEPKISPIMQKKWTSWSNEEEKTAVINMSTVDIESKHKVYWQDMFAIYQMVAKEHMADWRLKKEIDEEPDEYDDPEVIAEEADEYKLTDVMSEEEINKVIDSVTYTYDYYYDGSRGDNDIKLDEIESICYYETDAGDLFNTATHQESGTVKVPITVPVQIRNGVEVIVADVDATTHILKRYKRMVSTEKMEDSLYGIVDDFQWDLFIEILALLPGSEERVEYYKSVMESSKNGSEIQYLTIAEVLGEGCPDKIYIGTDCIITNPGDESGYSSNVGYGAWDLSGCGDANMTLAMKDDITAEQIDILIEQGWKNSSYCNKKCMLLGTGSAFYQAQEDFGVSALGMLAIALNESAYGTSSIAISKNNFFGWGAEDQDPYTLAWSFTGPSAGVYNVIKKIAANYTYGTYKQDTYYKMRFNQVDGKATHQYATDPEWHTKKAKIRAMLMENAASQFGCGRSASDGSSQSADASALDIGNISYDDFAANANLPTVKLSDVKRMLAAGNSYLKTAKYVWGTTGEYDSSRNAVTFDCSGFVKVLYRDYLGIYLPRNSGVQAASGYKISRSQLMPGDLVFSGSGGTIGHVRMYVGNGKCIEAANEKIGLRTSNVDDRANICYCRYFIIDSTQ